jgi:hypothetical protein
MSAQDPMDLFEPPFIYINGLTLLIKRIIILKQSQR